jgi:glutamine amidotransferase-like uncharacterized protein
VAQGVSPEFKPRYCQKEKQRRERKKGKQLGYSIKNSTTLKKFCPFLVKYIGLTDSTIRHFLPMRKKF